MQPTREQLEQATATVLEARERLQHLVSKIDGNERLDQVLQDVVRNTDALKQLQSETSQRPATGEEN